MNLRDYQQECVTAVWNEIMHSQTALVVMSTGSGKSVCIYELIRKSLAAADHVKCLVLFDTVLLLSQQAEALKKAIGTEQVSIYCGSHGEYDLSGRVVVGTIQSLKPDALNFNLVIVDECFTRETEVLTENGFVRFDSLTKKELVAQFNQDTQEISFCRPLRYVEKDFDGEIIVAKNIGGVDIRATKNHEILLRRPGRNVKIPLHKANFNYLNKIYKSGFAVGEQEHLTPYEKLMIATQADGSLHSKYKVHFAFSKERKIDAFLKLMKEGRFRFEEISAGISTGNKRQQRRFSVHIDEKFSKNVYEFFDLKSLSLNKCREIIEYMVLWDGSVVKKDYYYYSSVVKKNVDFYQAVACLAGHSARVTIQKDNRSKTFSDVHRLFIRMNTTTCDTQQVKKETKKYKGKVYCVTVPDGNIIIRSRGKIAVVGNCHMLDEKSGRYIEFLKNQMDQNPKTKIVGFTATPYRADGYIYGKNKFFSHPTFERGLKFFINKGILVPPVAKQPDHQMDLSKMRVVRGEYKQEDIDAQAMNKGMAKDQVIDALNRAQDRKKILWFCSSINHAELINDILDELGEYSVTLHSKLETDERSDATNSFMNGEARHLTFITVVSKGWDYPPVDCIVMMRPTRSPSLMVQVAGRGLRRYESKSDCLILDYANVISTMGPLEDPAIEKKGKGTGEAPRQKTCPECRAYIAPRATECPHCGFTWPKAEATKLMLVADENAPLLEKEFKTLEISKVQMKLHVSKAGNKCIRIDYLPKNFFQDPVAEYFTVDSDFGMKKFILRAIDLGIDLKSSAEEQVVQPITKRPTSINYVIENRYPKIKGLRFI